MHEFGAEPESNVFGYLLQLLPSLQSIVWNTAESSALMRNFNISAPKKGVSRYEAKNSPYDIRDSTDIVANAMWALDAAEAVPDTNSGITEAVEGDSISPAVGVKIDVDQVSYSVLSNGRVKPLLRDITFTLNTGCMCALMGPSGAGKSTLLDLMAGRKLVGNWSGEMLFNDSIRSPYFCRDSAYVLQDDFHLATLTVEETIYFSARVKMSDIHSERQIHNRVNSLLRLMKLEHIRDRYVGDALHKGISGGQLKRLSIATEIVHLPNLIFLDEPTSGLDSSIALEVMSVVRSLANQNRSCLCTIHQPSPEVFELFDELLLMSQGRIIYAGSNV
jgi:ABC-type multidrug transport system ATPase subunit